LAAVLIYWLDNQEAEVQDEYEKTMRPAHGAQFIVSGHRLQEESAAAAAPGSPGKAGSAATATGKTFDHFYRGTFDN
jgi:hypothetical protein